MLIVYYSNVSEYTHRFVQKLNTRSMRIPLKKEDELLVNEPYILITPTYGNGVTRVVPPPVVRFLTQEQNAQHLQGVIGTGNTNFNADYCKAATRISRRFQVPLLYKLELLGTPENVEDVKTIIGELTPK